MSFIYFKHDSHLSNRIRIQMKHHSSGKAQIKQKKQGSQSLKLPYSFIFLSYGILPVITPTLGAWDSNGTKFLFLAILNIFSFIFLFTQIEIKRNSEIKLHFFGNRIGAVYSFFLLISLLSFFKAINIGESLITFSMFFTAFMASYIISIIIRSDRRYINQLCIALVLLLIIDSVVVFLNILAYINGDIPSISSIKSIYSNKNILSSAIFVKIPFALWLLLFGKNRIRNLGLTGVFMGVTAIFFLSTRAFYIGIIILAILLFAFILIRYLHTKERRELRFLFLFGTVIALAFIVFSCVQLLLFSKLKQEDYNRNIFTRLSTINGEFSRETGGRLIEWKMSGNLIKENPFLGVGIGNWKISILKQENKIKEGLNTFLHRNHNDFIQITVETGIPGGLLFVTIFILTGMSFFVSFFKKGATEDSYKFLFIPAIGLLCYSIDAFFNFPFERPEIVSLFAIFVGTGVGLSGPTLFSLPSLQATSQASRKGPAILAKFPVYILIPLMLGTIYVLYLNYNSLKFQLVVVNDLLSKPPQLSSDRLLNDFPCIPTVNVFDEPIALIKSRYLILEGKYEDAVTILKNDGSSPFYANNQYFLAVAYSNLGQPDSALLHYKNASLMKPLCFEYVFPICTIYEKNGNLAEAKRLNELYLERNKNHRDAWRYAAYLSKKVGDLTTALAYVNSGLFYCKEDTVLVKEKESLERAIKLGPYETLYRQAISAYQKENYPESVIYLTDLIKKEPGLTEIYEYRAKCYFLLKKYSESISDIDRIISAGVQNGSLYNLRGIILHKLGDDSLACRDFQKAIGLGNKDASVNYQRYCIDLKK